MLYVFAHLLTLYLCLGALGVVAMTFRVDLMTELLASLPGLWHSLQWINTQQGFFLGLFLPGVLTLLWLMMRMRQVLGGRSV